MNATSKAIFKVSRSGTPSKKERYKGKVTADKLNVRSWAGRDSPTVSFSPLCIKDVVSVCDAILSDSGDTWYYIRYNGKYGFVNAKYIETFSKPQWIFLACLEGIHKFVKANPAYFEYRYDGSLTTFKKVKERVDKKQIVGFTCLVPCRLALKEAGVKRADGKSLIVGYRGTFATTYTGECKDYLARITRGDAIGKTVVQAVEKNLLKAGDIICFEDLTHTFVYSGDGFIMYDGGNAAIKDGIYTGIRADYSKHYKNRRISEILRWKQED